MSNYDFRDRPAYPKGFKTYFNASYDLWWSEAHNELAKKLMKEYRWNWIWKFSDCLHEATSESEMRSIKRESNWYNKVMNYAATRCSYLGLEYIDRPKIKKCKLCENDFTEDSLPFPLMERFGAYDLDYCAPCLRDSVLQNSGSEKLSKQEIINFIKNLAKVLELIPPQGYGEGKSDFKYLTSLKRYEVLKVLQKKPTYRLVRQEFGSWLKALIAAELLLDGTRETSRGIQTFATDGHLCLSLGEKTIDDYLHQMNIPHSREIYYPNTNYRTDFVVENVYIEYFGLAGNKEYDLRIEEKKKICKRQGILLIEIYPKDLVSIEKLSKKLELLNQYAINT